LYVQSELRMVVRPVRTKNGCTSSQN